MVRAHTSRTESLRFDSDSMPWMNARSLFTQQRMGTWWQHCGDKGGEERNWPPYLTCRWLRISVLSNRHSPTYESIRDYLYLMLSSGVHVMYICMYARVPNKRGGLINRGSENIPNFNKREGRNFRKGFKCLYKDGKNRSRLSWSIQLKCIQQYAILQWKLVVNSTNKDLAAESIFLYVYVCI